MKRLLLVITVLAVICAGTLIANAGTVVSSVLEVQSKTLQFLDGVAAYFGTDNDANIKFVAANSQVELTGAYAFVSTSTVQKFYGGALINDDKTIAFGNDGDWVLGYDASTSHNLLLSAALATSSVKILLGNWLVGAGTPNITIDGGDGYVTDDFEVGDDMMVGGDFTANGATASTMACFDANKKLVSCSPTVRSGANTACTTTCTGHLPVLAAWNTDTSFSIVAANDAAADGCYCAN